MRHEVITLFAQYGLLPVFISVFVDQASVSVPSLVVARTSAASIVRSTTYGSTTSG